MTGLLDRLLGAPEKKDFAARPLIVQFGAGRPKAPERDLAQLAEEGYKKNIVVYRVVRLISQNAAAVPWQLFRGEGDRRTELTDHPLLDLLARPNPLQGGAQFFESAYAFFLIAGNSFIEGAGPDRGPPRELWPLRPDRMKVVPGVAGLPEAYEFKVGGRAVRFPVDPATGRSAVLHSRTFNPLEDFWGLSPLEAAAFSIDQHNEAGRWNTALLQNGARPSGALVYSPRAADEADVLTDDQRRLLRAELEEHYTGGGRAGRPLILEGGLDWKEMSLSPKDMDWLAGKDVSAREIALAYNVPPQLVGIEGSLTFANFEQARLSLFEDAVLPLLDFFKDELNCWLAPAFGEGLRLEFDADAIPGLAARREKVWERVRSADFLTINEKRAATGHEPIEGGDVLFVPATMVPLGLAGDTGDQESGT